MLLTAYLVCGLKVDALISEHSAAERAVHARDERCDVVGRAQRGHELHLVRVRASVRVRVRVGARVRVRVGVRVRVRVWARVRVRVRSYGEGEGEE